MLCNEAAIGYVSTCIGAKVGSRSPRFSRWSSGENSGALYSALLPPKGLKWNTNPSCQTCLGLFFFFFKPWWRLPQTSQSAWVIEVQRWTKCPPPIDVVSQRIGGSFPFCHGAKQDILERVQTHSVWLPSNTTQRRQSNRSLLGLVFLIINDTDNRIGEPRQCEWHANIYIYISIK